MSEPEQRRRSWRDVMPVHPAADVFPLLPPGELAALAEDIRASGLTEAMTFWERPGGRWVLLDGRNRLDAMEAAGFTLANDAGQLVLPDAMWRPYVGDDPAGFVVTVNVRRRHLTKLQQAELIIRAYEASGETPASVAGVSRGSRGPAKDLVKARVVQLAEREGISARTVERAFARTRAPAEPIAGQLDLLTGEVVGPRWRGRPARRGERGWPTWAFWHPGDF
jgi:hypothetical protein